MFCAATVSYIAVDLFSVRGWKRLLPQCYFIGTRSVPVIMLTGTFVGMVLLVQGYDQFDNADNTFQALQKQIQTLSEELKDFLQSEK